MKHYYLKDNRIWMANEKMPKEPFVTTNDYDYAAFIGAEYNVELNNWHSSLQPCEISESELDKVIKYKKHIFSIGNPNWDEKINDYLSNPIDVTDVIFLGNTWSNEKQCFIDALYFEHI